MTGIYIFIFSGFRGLDARKSAILVCKTNFTDHHTLDTIYSFTDSVLVCKMHDCCCTIGKNLAHFHSFPSSDASDCNGWLDYMKTNHFKILLNIFSTTYTYSNCVVY